MPLLSWHEQRFAATQFYAFGTLRLPSLQYIIAMQLPENLQPDIVYKCRVEYDGREAIVDFAPYSKKNIRKIVATHTQELDYSFKYADRQQLDALKVHLKKDSEVLIINNGLVTDSTFTNVAFSKNDEWFTPANPLLEGIQRAHLIEKKILKPAIIHAEDVKYFRKIRLFNALVDWADAWEFAVNDII